MTFRVVQVHSEYAHRGGEEMAVEMDAAMLRAHGAEVWPVVRSAVRSNALEMAGEVLGSPMQLGLDQHPSRAPKADHRPLQTRHHPPAHWAAVGTRTGWR